MLKKTKILRNLISQFKMSKDLNATINNSKPPIFWKEKDIVKKQAQSWSTEEVKEIIFKINELEAIVKRNAGNSMLFVSNFVSNY